MYTYIYIYIYPIMNTMCPPDYHLNGFVVTHALGNKMNRTHHIHELLQSRCGNNRESTLFS